MAPFDVAAYTAGRKTLNYEGKCGVNLLWSNPVHSVTPFVPLYIERVLDQAAAVNPGLQKTELTLLANFATGEQLPRGSLIRISPEEPVHAFLFKVAERLSLPCDDQEKEAWKRTILSYPAKFIRIDTDDLIFAEAQSLRLDAGNHARLVMFTVRQLCYNVYGFKRRKEAATKQVFGAMAIADFYKDNVRMGSEGSHMCKKNTIDTALTLMDRFFSAAGVEDIVARSEAEYGPDSCFNNLYKCQEIVYRGGTPKKISHVVCCIDDCIQSKKITNAEVTMVSIKTGTKSLSDPYMMQLALKQYLLGPWLDSIDFPGYIKAKAREVFKDHAAYRTLYQPICGDIDTTYMLHWPEVGRSLFKFLEGALYTPTPSEEYHYRNAIRNNNTPEELMSWKPFIDTIATIRTTLLTTVETAPRDPQDQDDAPIAAPPTQVAGTAGAPPKVLTVEEEEHQREINDAASRFERGLCGYAEEPHSVTALTLSLIHI